MRRLEVGGGTLVRPGWDNLDPVHGSPGLVIKVQLLGPHTPSDLAGQYDEVRASHVMEHIPAGEERVHAMNAMWKLLRPGGTLEVVVPVVGYTAHAHLAYTGSGTTMPLDGGPRFAGWQAWADPTHVSFWWMPESFWYFTGGPSGAFRANADYGILYWEELSMELRDGWEARVLLRRPA